MIRFSTVAGTILKVTALLVVTLSCIAAVYMFGKLLISTDARDALMGQVGLKTVKYKPSQADLVVEEIAKEHFAVLNWVMACAGIDNFFDAPPRVRGMLEVSLPGYFAGSGPGAQGWGKRVPNQAEIAVLQLSRSLANQRYVHRRNAQEAYQFWQFTSLIVIALGMITTILVSLSSTEFGRGDGAHQRIIRVLAITFPALGTAAAAVVSFYGPQAEWSQSTRSAASFAQLHSQVVAGVSRWKCIDGEPAAQHPAFVQIDDWSKRYLDVLTVANATGETGTGSAAPAPNKPLTGSNSTAGQTAPPKPQGAGQ